MKITSKEYWSAVTRKLIETFISVKLWIVALASYFAIKMLYIYIDMKNFIFTMVENGNADPRLISTITTWSSELLDVTLAMFTGVIITVVLSREVFKHTRISTEYKYDNMEEKSKDKMI